MLSSDIPMTPRPLPPAKARRSSSHTRDWRSPPLYAPFAVDAMPTLLGSPISATSQLIRPDEPCEEQVQERSKEELEELLRRASTIIKEREQELDMTSETCKTLAENNAALKTRNDALIARLPSSQPSSPLLSPPIGSGLLVSPSHSRGSSRSLLWSPKPAPGRRRAGHTRRISSTPAELAALADQNAELLAKLTDLEAEASHAEQAGKRRLRGLETEIENLRDELERTRAESERLEETLHSAPQEGLAGLPAGLDSQVVKMYKRLSREAKVRELKAKTRPWEQGEKLEEPKDFAPSNLIPGLPFTSTWVSRNLSTPSLSLETSVNEPFNVDRSPKEARIDSPLTPIPSSVTSTIGPNSREQALVSQLLLKIRELEETNTQLAANHHEASMRLRVAQTESESVRRLCEFISEEVDGDLDVELEIVDDDDDDEDLAAEMRDNDPSALQTSPKKTLRLRSVGRKTSLDFGSGSSRNSVRLRKFKSMDSLPSSETSAVEHVGHHAGIQPPKIRKTVLGLFEEDSSLGSPTLSSTPPYRSRYSPDRSSGPQPSFALESFESDGMLGDTEADGSQMPSLESELGPQSHGLQPAPGHTRSKSILELLHGAEAASPQSTTAPSPPALQPPAPTLKLSRSWSQLHRNAEGEEYFPMDERITYPRLRRARSSAVLGAPSSPSTSRVLDRQTNSTTQTGSPSLVDSAHTPSYTPLRSLPASSGRQGQDSMSQQKNKLDKFMALFVELWLWMHFAAVIAVFVFTMARMGPKVFFNKPLQPAKKGSGGAR